jgi:hypothetical protein
VIGVLGRTAARPLLYVCHILAEEYVARAEMLRPEGLSSQMCLLDHMKRSPRRMKIIRCYHVVAHAQILVVEPKVCPIPAPISSHVGSTVSYGIEFKKICHIP